MPKNKGRGGKNYKKGMKQNETKRELIYKEYFYLYLSEETEYA